MGHGTHIAVDSPVDRRDGCCSRAAFLLGGVGAACSGRLRQVCLILIGRCPSPRRVARTPFSWPRLSSLAGSSVAGTLLLEK
jgi:hypothetical protein